MYAYCTRGTDTLDLTTTVPISNRIINEIETGEFEGNNPRRVVGEGVICYYTCTE